ncbi:gamma-glutamyltranspeptidase domain-containing protein [Sarocladium implicatum]|nr:gamma-glutamyltranspeptidase domain-containing protein [Sarocladium implicatum]
MALTCVKGNAVDALVGTVFCVGVIGAHHSGIGGGGFVLIRDKDGNYEAVDFREAAPAAAHEDMYKDDVALSMFGGLAAGVPGEVRGLGYIHSKYGVLPWKKVMAGAIYVARNGYRVSFDQERLMNSAIKTAQYDFFTTLPDFAEDFAPNGTLVKEGDFMTRKRYADTLEKIANEGPDSFYQGEIAEAIIDTLKRGKGIMTLQDLANYDIISRNVTTTTYRNLTLHGIGSPAGGAIAFHILKTMEQFPQDALFSDEPLTNHRLVEAMRFAYGARLQLGDPAFVAGVQEIEDRMIDEERAKETYGKILDESTQPVENYLPKKEFMKDSHGTSHIATADDSGMATSLTTTVNLLYGNLMVEPKTGIILNNEMNDFSIPGEPNEFGFPPSEANFIRPFKRPLSSCTPMIVTSNDSSPSSPNLPSFLATLGAGGGSRIVSATAQVLWRVVDHDFTMAEAITMPRLHDQLMPNTTLLEEEMRDDWRFWDVVQGLAERGHGITWVTPTLSAVQGILMKHGRFEAASESRQKNSGGLTL